MGDDKLSEVKGLPTPFEALSFSLRWDIGTPPEFVDLSSLHFVFETWRMFWSQSFCHCTGQPSIIAIFIAFGSLRFDKINGWYRRCHKSVGGGCITGIYTAHYFLPALWLTLQPSLGRIQSRDQFGEEREEEGERANKPTFHPFSVTYFSLRPHSNSSAHRSQVYFMLGAMFIFTSHESIACYIFDSHRNYHVDIPPLHSWSCGQPLSPLVYTSLKSMP